MDDLTTLPLIGKATAKKLVAVGIDSFAKVAGAGHADLRAILSSASSDDLQKLQDAATAKLQPAPVTSGREMTDDELRALVEAWDNARADLNAAGDAVAEIQTRLAALAPDADRSALDGELAAAQAKVAAAHQVIAALKPLPDGVKLPDAKKNEIPAGRQGNADGQAGNDTQPHQQTAQGPEEGSAKDAPLETGAVAGAPELADLDAMFRTELGRLSAERGTAPADLYEFAHMLLSERDGLENDLEAIVDAVEEPASIDMDLGEEVFPITVIGPVGGRRRAGFEFGAAPRTILVTAEQMALLEADKSLAVSRGELPPASDVTAVRQRLAAKDFTFTGPVGQVTVLGPAKGRRRAGFDFGATAQTIEVNADQLASILSDDSLAVTPA